MQLAEQLDHLVLGGCTLAERAVRVIPQLADRATAVHRGDQRAGGGREAVHAARGAVLQQVPDLAAIAMAVQARVRTQAGPERGHPVPGITEELGAQGTHRQAVRRSQSTSGCAQIQASLRRPAAILPTPSMPGRSRAEASSSCASTRKKLWPSSDVETGVICFTAKRSRRSGMPES